MGALRTSICVAAQLRSDQQFELRLHPSGEGADAAETRVALPMSAVIAHASTPINGRELWSRIPPALHEFAAPLFAVIRALLPDYSAQLAGGVTLRIEPTEAWSPLTGGPAALASAATHALVAAAHKLEDDRNAIMRLLERVAAAPDCDFGGLRFLLAGSVTPLHALLQMSRQRQSTLTPVDLPHGVILVAIETHPARPILRERVAESHVAAMMGHRIIQELLRQDGKSGDATAGFLVNISPNDYVESIRNRLNAKISGRLFLERFGGGDAFRAVNPAAIYKPRSRAEHHIYENQRVHEFASCLLRMKRSPNDKPLVDAGELMYASHWSHSQRCGLGSVETDVVSKLVRDAGPTAGLYGAKLASGWCGGLMVVLMRDTPDAHAALQQLAAQAAAKFGTPVRIHGGNDAGASIAGALPLESAVGMAGVA